MLKWNQPMAEPAAARLDRATEDELYALFRAYFADAEDARRWSPWSNVPWDEAFHPPAALVEMVVGAYRDDLFLPDFSTRTIRSLRGSRGRAWFATRWSYEKGKQLIGLSEWLLRSHVYSDADLRAMLEGILGDFAWESPFKDAASVMADVLLWETQTTRRNLAIQVAAREAGDAALVALMSLILNDQAAARKFFADALTTMRIRHSETTDAAILAVLARVTADDAAEDSLETGNAAHEVASLFGNLGTQRTD